MEDKESSYGTEEEQKSPLPFLEDGGQEDKAEPFSNMEAHWAGDNEELF